MKLQHAEQQEQEAVGAHEAGLKRGLLDLTLRVDAVARENVANVVEQHLLRDAVLFSRQREAVLAVVLVQRAAQGTLRQLTELDVTCGNLRVFLQAEQGRQRQAQHAATRA